MYKRQLHKIFTDYTRTHNQAVFDAYTPEMKAARHTHIITGLPDTYGRGRIVGDYRRVALYGIDALIKFKQEDFANCGDGTMTDDVIRLREEIARQISALKSMKKMAEAYGWVRPERTPASIAAVARKAAASSAAEKPSPGKVADAAREVSKDSAPRH